MREQKGITLVVLIITVIVLLILATVSVQVLTGDNGLLNKTETAVQSNKDSQEEEKVKLAVVAAQLAGQGNITTDNLKKELRINFNDNTLDVEEETDGEGWLFNKNKEYKIYKNGKVEVENGRLLPKEYKQVEYIESTGGQYFLLDLVSTANFGFDIELYVKPNTGANVFGGFSRGEQAYCYLGTRNNKITYYPSIGSFDFNSIDYNVRHSYKVINKGMNLSYYYDNIECGTGNFANNVNCSIAVFSFVDNNGIVRTSENETFIGRIYKFIIYDNETVICNLIPCYRKSDKEVGMYDIINNKFYTNQGTGQFNVSHVISPTECQQVEYIESTGTQYIDTGYIPNSNTTVEIKAANKSINNTCLYCARTGTKENTFSAFLINGNSLRVDYYDNQYGNLMTVTNDVAYVYKHDKNKVYVNGELKQDLLKSEFNAKHNMYLLASHIAGTELGNIQNVKLYYCKIWDNGILIRNMIPYYRKSDNKPGLLDLVNNEFYTNKNTSGDDFMLGPDV